MSFADLKQEHAEASLPTTASGKAPSFAALVGTSMQRVEDDRFIRGQGSYVADMVLPGMLHAVVLRSTMAHAVVRGIDTEAARALPGVVAVLTGRDLEHDGIGAVPWEVMPPTPSGTAYDSTYERGDPRIASPQPLLAIDRVRYVGEGIALIVAETAALARDAADLIEVDYEPLPAVTDMAKAVGGAEPIWPAFEDNVCFCVRVGDAREANEAFASAAYIVSLSLINNRLAPNPIEPRGYIGCYDAQGESWTLHASAGKPHGMRNTLAQFVMKVDPKRIHVLVPDIGGGFGAKNVLYPEEGLVLWAARAVGRPVRWISDRMEAIATDMAGRDQLNTSELALDHEGQILGLRTRTLANLGAYLAPRGVVPPRNSTKTMQGLYRLPTADVEVRGVFTNTGPTCSYRGAGQPEGLYIIERLLDEAARVHGFDRVELRRKNLIAPDELPYKTLSNLTLDSGLFEANMDVALQQAEWSGFAARARESAARGRLRGIGMANMLEASGHGYSETATVEAHADGTIEILIGTQSGGQSHATVYTQILAEALQIDPSLIKVVQGDTARIATGNGTGACRSLSVGGSAVKLAGDNLIEAGREKAGKLLEAGIDDIEYAGGTFRIIGTDRVLDLRELAQPGDPLAVAGSFDPDNFTFPNGCHIAEVEVDPETGVVTILDYTAVQDVGRAVNPMVVEGQLHGGIAQGVGQALLEHTIFADDGQLMTGSFMDYGMPRADGMPSMRISLAEVPAPSNPLGVKAVGEAGPTAAPPAVVNAVLDALAPLGVAHVDMPLTPSRVWQAICEAKRRRAKL